jgi:tetratricopeptide (TPR) repeat protein
MRKGITVLFILCLNTGLFSQDCLKKDFPLPALPDSTRQLMLDALEKARETYAKDTTDADALIWYGRRMAYPGFYRDAIGLFTRGMLMHPQDARFLRHRGHRYLTVRCFDPAVADLEKAAKMTLDQTDQTEPDGMPNARNIPTSTLKTNIWYHLGLAYYLKKEYKKAAASFQICLGLSRNPDMYAAAAYWLYISLKRSHADQEAADLLVKVPPDLSLIENEAYYLLLLLYKGLVAEDEVLSRLHAGGESLANATTGYALGVYFLLADSTQRSQALFKQVLTTRQWASFGFICAESEDLQ